MNGTHPWEEREEHSRNDGGRPGQPEPTRPMPMTPPSSEEFSSSRHDPGYGDPAGAPPTQAEGFRSPAHYPAQPQHPHQPGPGGPDHPQQGAPGPGWQQSQGAPAGQRRSGSCFGVVVALFQAVFAGVGTLLILNTWLQVESGGSLGQLINAYLSRPALLWEELSALPALLIAAGMCVVAAFFLPSRLGALRGLGAFLMLAATVCYVYGVLFWIQWAYLGTSADLIARTVERWQSLGSLWPSVLVADVVLIPAFLLLTLIAFGASRPRRV